MKSVYLYVGLNITRNVADHSLLNMRFLLNLAFLHLWRRIFDKEFHEGLYCFAFIVASQCSEIYVNFGIYMIIIGVIFADLGDVDVNQAFILVSTRSIQEISQLFLFITGKIIGQF